MASDSFPQEADARTKPDPEDGSSPSTEPALPTVATSAIALEPPTPEAFAPSSVALGPTVVRPRLGEAIRVEIVTAPKTSEERAWGLGFFALVSLVLRIPGRPSLSGWVAFVRGLRPHPRPFEWLALAGIASIAALVFYQATTERIIETDSLIYHAPLAALVYYHGGLPWIVGGGVGLSSSANYPQAFSLLGAYYYAWTGGVNDLYLRLIGAANWSLAIYATFLIGRRLAGRPHGALAAVLAALVPSFASYAFLATQETTLVMFGALGFLALLKATRAKRPGYAIVGGLLLGGAALTSYQGLYFILPVVVLYAIALLRRWNVRLRAFRQAEPIMLLLTLLVAVAAGCAPYVRNWILLGDPLYPFYRGLFSSPYLSPTTMVFAETAGRRAALALAAFVLSTRA